jgi:hypothetical protein
VPERRTVTFTSQGALKIERAGRQFRGIEQDVDAWNAEHQVYAPSRSPWDGDPRVQIFRPPEVDALPWFDWEATFHDGVHNLRAGLDNLCFELAHLDDVAPSKPRQIYFPMSKDEKGWQDRAKYLESVPRSLLDRLRECQPWARPDPMNPDPPSPHRGYRRRRQAPRARRDVRGPPVAPRTGSADTSAARTSCEVAGLAPRGVAKHRPWTLQPDAGRVVHRGLGGRSCGS